MPNKQDRILDAIGNVVHPAWRASAIGVLAADLLGVASAMWLVVSFRKLQRLFSPLFENRR
jgi:hypothetical protein